MIAAGPGLLVMLSRRASENKENDRTNKWNYRLHNYYSTKSPGFDLRILIFQIEAHLYMENTCAGNSDQNYNSLSKVPMLILEAIPNID